MRKGEAIMTELLKPDEMRGWLTDLEKWLDTDAESTVINIEMIRAAPEAAHRAMLKMAQELKELRRAAPAVSPVAASQETPIGYVTQSASKHFIDRTAEHVHGEGLCISYEKHNADDVSVFFSRPTAQQSVSPVAVGVVDLMPGMEGFTMACFKADDVPAGSKLGIITNTAQDGTGTNHDA
jgi:hypothetical protein